MAATVAIIWGVIFGAVVAVGLSAALARREGDADGTATEDEPGLSVCARCKHQGWGNGVHPPREPGQRVPPPVSGVQGRGDYICLKHPRGRTPIDPVTGLGGDRQALHCIAVNRNGDCKDFEPKGRWS